MIYLSAIIPSYEHADFILTTLETFLESSVVREIIIIDDASKDNSVDIISRFVEENEKNKEIKFIRKTENKGLVDSIRIGLNNATESYVYICSSDDYPIITGLSDALLKINDTSLDFAIFGGFNFFENGIVSDIYGVKHNIFFGKKRKKNFHKRYLISHPSPILIQSTIYRREIVKGLFNENIKFDDYPIFFRLFEKISFGESVKFEFFPDIRIVKYRHHNSNTYKNIYKMYCMYEEFYRSLDSQYKICCFLGLSNKLSYYIIRGIKMRNSKVVLALLKKADIFIFLSSIIWVPFILLSSILKK